VNYTAYLAHVKQRLTALGFQEIAPTGDLAGELGLALERTEGWGSLILALPGKPNLSGGEEQRSLVNATAGWVRHRPAKSQLILIFPFDRRVAERESAAVLSLRLEDPAGSWAVIPWTADLEVELLDQHKGFPPVPPAVARALTEVPRGAVERFSRPSSAGAVGGARPVVDLGSIPVTRTLLAATIAFYLWLLLMDRSDSLFDVLGWIVGGPSGETLVTWGANNGALVFFGGQQWRLLSHMLLHGGIWHLGFNMWALWQLGQYAESVYGSRQTLIIYLLAGIAGGIASTTFRPELATSVGASGAIFGLFGALIYWGWTFKDRPLNWHGLWGPVATNLLIGFFLPFVDNYGHVGGFLGGILAGFLVGVPGEREGWKHWALGGVGVLLALVLTGIIPLPWLGSL